MAIKGRVGKHLSTNKQCQNWPEDQLVVIRLLNKIPVADGGTNGVLPEKTYKGLASKALCQAIAAFEKKQFPPAKGFVDPGGRVLAKLESLATVAAAKTASAMPKAPSTWDNIKSKSVDDSLREALEDLTITHAEAVNMVRATLSDGIIRAAEIADLKEVADKSKTLSPASRLMFDTMAEMISKTPGGRGPFRFSTDQKKFAADMLCKFLESGGPRAFSKLSRFSVGVGALMRVGNPGLLHQDQASLCGPAVLLFNTLMDNPVVYARYVIDLFEKGRAPIGRNFVEPGSDVRSYSPPSSMDQVDWMTMASLRDSENFLFDYDEADDQFAGITMPGELAHWFRRAGYSDVREETNVYFNKGTGTMDDANRLYNQGYRVCLFIGAEMLTSREQTDDTTVGNHWVVQRSPMLRQNGNVSFNVFTWGEGDRAVPENPGKPLSVSDFLENFYGYVAAKP